MPLANSHRRWRTASFTVVSTIKATATSVTSSGWPISSINPSRSGTATHRLHPRDLRSNPDVVAERKAR